MVATLLAGQMVTAASPVAATKTTKPLVMRYYAGSDGWESAECLE